MTRPKDVLPKLSTNSFFLLVAFFTFPNPYIVAQNATDVHRYATDPFLGDAYAMSLSGSFSMFFGSVANATINPATMALSRRSEFSFSLGGQYLDEQSIEPALGFSGSGNRFKTIVPDFSYLYKFPTEQGSMVFGWSLARTNDFSRKTVMQGFNPNTTITDSFAEDDFYIDTAWESYAIDSVGGRLVPTLRLGSFQGINQDYSLTETGGVQELNFFWATEFRKNIFVGASAVLPFGRYSYTRTMVESDYENRYNDFGIGNDVDDIVAQDNIDAKLRGAYFRIGLVAKPVEWLNVSLAYRSSSKLNISENYRTAIQTRFDNSEVYSRVLEGDVDYSVRTPGRFLAGIGVDFSTIRGAVSAEWVNYSDSRISFDASVFDRDLAILERSINSVVSGDFRNTMRLQAGLEFGLSPDFTLRASASKLPETRRSFNQSPFLFAGGFSTKLSNSIRLDGAIRHSGFGDANAVYTSEEGSLMSDDSVRNTYVYWTIRFGF